MQNLYAKAGGTKTCCEDIVGLIGVKDGHGLLLEEACAVEDMQMLMM